MNNTDIRWTNTWIDHIYHQWGKQAQWCSLNRLEIPLWLDYLLAHIESDLLHHKKTACRNRRMRYIIVESFTTLKACEIINEMDLNG